MWSYSTAIFPTTRRWSLCKALSQRGEPPRMILLSQASDPKRIVHGIEAGAVGWVRKDAIVQFHRLIEVIHGVARGETWLPASDTGQVLRLLLRRPDPEHDGTKRAARRADSARTGGLGMPRRWYRAT